MHTLTRHVLCALALLCCTTLAFAQEQQSAATQAAGDYAGTKTPYPYIGCDSAEYKSQPRRYLTTVHEDARGSIDLLICIEPNKDAQHWASDGVIDFISHSDEFRFMYHGKSVFLVDGQPVHLSDRSLTSAGIKAGGSITEVESNYISYANFLKLAKGAKVEVIVVGSKGGLRYELKPEHLAALRDLAKTFEQ